MEFKVTSDILDALPYCQSLHSPLRNMASCGNPKLKDYIFIHGQVIHVIPNRRTMTPLRLFKEKKLLAEMHHKTVGCKLQDSFIAFDLLEGRKSIEEVLNICH